MEGTRRSVENSISKTVQKNSATSKFGVFHGKKGIDYYGRKCDICKNYNTSIPIHVTLSIFVVKYH